MSWNKGTLHTEETKRKMSETHIGEKNVRWGKRHSKETIQKMSQANMGKHHTEKAKRKIGLSQLGEKNNNWKGGISTQTAIRLGKSDWVRLAHKIRKRDNHWCLYCKEQRGEVVHHMLPDRLGGTDDETNLVTLCRSCHHFIESKIID